MFHVPVFFTDSLHNAVTKKSSAATKAKKQPLVLFKRFTKSAARKAGTAPGGRFAIPGGDSDCAETMMLG